LLACPRINRRRPEVIIVHAIGKPEAASDGSATATVRRKLLEPSEPQIPPCAIWIDRRRMALSMKLAEQGLGLSQVACVKTFGEPIVDGGEKVTCRLPLSLIAQEPRQAHGRAQFP
jgi:hypothetical protein